MQARKRDVWTELLKLSTMDLCDIKNIYKSKYHNVRHANQTKGWLFGKIYWLHITIGVSVCDNVKISKLFAQINMSYDIWYKSEFLLHCWGLVVTLN